MLEAYYALSLGERKEANSVYLLWALCSCSLWFYKCSKKITFGWLLILCVVPRFNNETYMKWRLSHSLPFWKWLVIAIFHLHLNIQSNEERKFLVFSGVEKLMEVYEIVLLYLYATVYKLISILLLLFLLFLLLLPLQSTLQLQLCNIITLSTSEHVIHWSNQVKSPLFL